MCKGKIKCHTKGFVKIFLGGRGGEGKKSYFCRRRDGGVVDRGGLENR